MSPLLRVSLLALLLLGGPARAQVFKCTDARGATIYTDAACPNAAVLSREDLESNTIPRGPRLQEVNRSVPRPVPMVVKEKAKEKEEKPARGEELVCRRSGNEVRCH